MLQASLCSLSKVKETAQNSVILTQRFIHQEFKKMPNITIDDKEYDTDTFSDATKAQLTSMRLADAEIQRLNIQLAIAQTARNAYALAVRNDLQELEKSKKK